CQAERGGRRGSRGGPGRARDRRGGAAAAPRHLRQAVTPRWSVVIPAFNEALRLPPFLDTVVAYFDGRDEHYEVVVVDDGSRGGTSEAGPARRYGSVRIIRREINGGKGTAVRTGMLAARGAYRLFADADGATPIQELKRLEAPLVTGADVAFGSRALRA